MLRRPATLERDETVVPTGSGEFQVGPKPLAPANRLQSAVQPEDAVLPLLREWMEKMQDGRAGVQRHPRFPLRTASGPRCITMAAPVQAAHRATPDPALPCNSIA